MKYLSLVLLFFSFNVLSSEWCPDKVAVAPILYEKKVQPLFFVAEDLLRDFSYTYKVSPSTAFCYLSLKHKGVNSTVNLFPPAKYQKELQIILNKKDVSMEDIAQSKGKIFSSDIQELLTKYSYMRDGKAWNVPIIKGTNAEWKPLSDLSINEMFAERINKIKVEYVSTFGWEYLYLYYLYIALRLFMITFLVVGFIFVKIKFSKNI